MLTEFIKRILEREREHFSNREVAVGPHVIVEKDSKEKENKYDSDIANLRLLYRDRFDTGFCITTSLQDLLRICPRERQRSDAYKGLISHLKTKYGITLTIKSRKGGNKNEPL